MAKIHQFCQSLASFSQNSVNTNMVEINDSNFDVKHIDIVVRLVATFIDEMTKHNDSSVPEEILPFTRSFFVKKDSAKITLAVTTKQKANTMQPDATIEDSKHKSEGTNPVPKKVKVPKEFSDKS
jgi:hypothetical protein